MADLRIVCVYVFTDLLGLPRRPQELPKLVTDTIDHDVDGLAMTLLH